MSFFSNHRPFLIAGPCSAESRQQVLQTASVLSASNIDLFRAGVWKPRTRPGNFEGIGEPALEWLKEVKKTLNLPVTIEVAEPTHIELALKYEIDVLWIGARTVVNPFHVQNLADCLKGIKIPVMVKNPVNPDIELWIGAIERLEKAGITDIAAVHRGFSGYGSITGYRNHPNWLIPIEMKRRRPDVALICDPSHISGNRDTVAEVAQKAMDLRFDGLMIETHINPSEALSDAKQQITPAELQTLLSNLIVKDEYTEDMSCRVKMENIRQLIDTLDVEIIDLIAKRMELSRRIGELKKEYNLTIYQPDRWREIVATCTRRAEAHQISQAFVLEIYEKIHHESIRTQLSVLEELQNEIKH